MAEAQRYPLAWPKHKPRTKSRRTGLFKEQRDSGVGSRPVSLKTALGRVEAELDRINGKLPILSSNLELRIDGRPRGDQKPSDPGVALYFTLDGKPHTMACDTFTEVAQNVAAIAAHLEASRAISRYGVATTSEVLHMFAALPPPSTPSTTTAAIPLGEGVKWWEVFGVVRETASLDDIDAIYRRRARSSGGGDALTTLNMARDAARAELSQKEA